MTEKFNVGDRVYDIQFGIGVVYTHLNGIAHSYPIEVTFELLSGEIRTYTACGRLGAFHANPTLLTLPEARAKGYDVPKEKVKKTIKRWVIVNTKTGWSALAYTPQKVGDDCIVKEVVFEWEEEV